MNYMNNSMPRVLISTVSGWADSVGSDTMSTLFSQYDKSKLASLYIRAEISDSTVCNKYFHFFEQRIIKSIFNRRIITGEGYVTSGALNVDTKDELQKERNIYGRFTNYRPWALILLREVLWKLGHWKTKELNDFIDDFQPEVLFFPIESYIHLNRINEYVIKRCKPKLVICNLWDDNFTYKQGKGIGFKIHRFWLRRHFKRLVQMGDVFIAQNQKMQKEFKEEFDKDTVLITKPIFNLGEFEQYKSRNPIRILYTGSLYINRDKSVMALSKAIAKVNKDHIKIELDVYSGTRLSDSQKNELELSSGCHFMGHIKQSEVFKKQKEADILLFVEDLSNRNLSARLSFSTKITDYLRAGKCILAIGNKDLAPIEYLKEQNAAIVCTAEEDILPALNSIVSDVDMISKYARSAYECGKLNHNGEQILSELYGIICDGILDKK